MKKIVISFTIAIFLLMILLGMFLVKRYRIDLNQEYIDDHLLLHHGTVLMQKFQASHNNLSTIKILEANNPIINSQAANKEPLRFVLSDDANNETIRTLDFSGANVGVLEKLQMNFVPIPDSKNHNYTLSIVSLSSPSAKLIPEISLGFSRINKVQGEYGLLSSPEPWIKGNLAFRTYYKDRLLFLSRDSILDLLGRMKMDPYFGIFYAGLLLILLITAIFAL